MSFRISKFRLEEKVIFLRSFSLKCVMLNSELNNDENDLAAKQESYFGIDEISRDHFIFDAMREDGHLRRKSCHSLARCILGIFLLNMV